MSVIGILPQPPPCGKPLDGEEPSRACKHAPYDWIGGGESGMTTWNSLAWKDAVRGSPVAPLRCSPLGGHTGGRRALTDVP